MVTIKKPGILRSLTTPRLGPFKVISHNDNGTITIELEPYETKTFNMRRIQPYYKREVAAEAAEGNNNNN